MLFGQPALQFYLPEATLNRPESQWRNEPWKLSHMVARRASERRNLFARQENLLSPDYRTWLLSSPGSQPKSANLPGTGSLTNSGSKCFRSSWPLWRPNTQFQLIWNSLQRNRASGTLINYEQWFLWVAVAIAHLPRSGYTEGWSSFGITSPNQLPGRKGATLFPPVTKQMCGFRARQQQQQQQKRSLGVKLWTEWHEFTTTAPGYMETVWGKCVNEIAWNTTTNNHVTLLLLWTVLFVPHAANL